MKYNSQKNTIFSAGIFILCIFALTDPIDILMPTNMQRMMLAAAIIAYAVFAGLVYKEKPADEREKYILAKSSRSAFLAGTTLLLIAVIVQTLSKDLDNWLIAALGGMIATKVITHYWNTR